MKKTENKGITLIALVITIIVLLILAGVSIAMLTGDNGIIKQAKNSKTETYTAEQSEQQTLGQYETYINKEIKDNAVVGEIVTGGNKLYTKNGTAIIPEGFKIVEGLDDVSKGLVIEDENKNQFVWIPVTSESQYTRNITYAYADISKSAYADTGYLPDGMQPNIPDTITDEKEIGKLNEEVEKKFVLNAGGFYISRYEAGKEEINGIDTLVSKKGASVWNNIKQEECKAVAKTFIRNGKVYSSLCSGIQWDLTMAFITQNDKTYNVNMANPSIHTDSLNNAGNNPLDVTCNIYDLEGNCFEYTAEKQSFNKDYPFVCRGGGYHGYSTLPASYRSQANGISSGDYSFRFILYVM